MKKILLITSFTALFSMAAFAQDAPGLKTDKAPPPPHKMEDGYRGMEDARSMTIKQAKTMHDGASVSLKGNLVKKTGEDLYQFRDKTGQIDVYIPMAVFDGKNVSPDELVGISGSLDAKQKPARVKVTHFQKQ
ncbi:YdeI family stress tolerance OB fold protein [Phytobacter diazotrophicus]|uniref:YdeI family stress tolerance OB fold protein n=1 Tax=Phytobacter diazotrophicus TaxID=395631 RepID=UPI00145238F3|nr:YdeI family stress tolerance OB fold protein [Phytobacter diazotrophicus]MDU7199434.1 YdeI family stress tolerance OB fold protein [Enterobacteriaceae bacterium]MDV2875220.1 YdeI family stress tolerance OB fold protein [Phytobacter diazotrophicus]QJF15643.1 YdeI family stress tolerance OB fold protein [Phytobacter diazotrophicus]